MCGIYGFALSDNQLLDRPTASKIVHSLAICSESRGKEASGFAAVQDGVIHVYKCPWPSARMLRSEAFRTVFGGNGASSGLPMAIGHSRLVTNGFEGINANNQPVTGAGSVAVHNGIIVNFREAWQQHFTGPVPGELDTTVMLALLEKFRPAESVPGALRKTYEAIDGMASVAVLFAELNALALATNNGSLYVVTDEAERMLLFASEKGILLRALKRLGYETRFPARRIRQLPAGHALVFAGDAGVVFDGPLARVNGAAGPPVTPRSPLVVEDRSTDDPGFVTAERRSAPPTLVIQSRWRKFFDDTRERIERMRRCTRCILPESFPFIDFDAAGVCNYCHGHRPITVKGRSAFEALLAQYRRPGHEAECVVSFSGGRDSTYCLHYLKEEMGMRPVAFTYDWGMITDLARRNQSRLCARLGIEHVLMSADIRRKRANIRLNVRAWLKRPSLGAVPLFMAGDKQFFYYAQELKKELGVDLLVLGENALERTNFKSGYCGIRPSFGTDHIYSLSRSSKLTMALFYAREYALNPAYLNRSLVDTAGAFGSYYVIPHNYVNIFDYIEWDEETVERVLRDRFDWEVAEDIKSTWRIGDGTAPFYNYIYYTVGGFSEFETFRSNQVREGVMSRQVALELAQTENAPRFEAIRWYCDTIGIDFEATIDRINSMPRVFPAR